MSLILPEVRKSFEEAGVQRLMKETASLWKRPSPFGFHEFDRTLARSVLDFFFGAAHELDLNRTVVVHDEGRVMEIRLLVHYTDEDDGTGVTRWFVYAPDGKKPDYWKWVESDEN